jgi:hypothetical protein
MEKKKIIYQETYKKGVVATNKQQIIDLIKAEDTKVFVVKAGKFADGTEFVTITVDFRN